MEPERRELATLADGRHSDCMYCSAVDECAPVVPTETLAGGGIVDLWFFFFDAVDDARLFAAYDALLASEERERCRGYRFERDRRQFLATRALVRTVLSRYAEVSPSDWRFALSEGGQPWIVAPRVTPSLHFSLSHTRGLIACAVSVDHTRLGVDVEALDRSGETVALAEHYFAPQEACALRRLPPHEQRRGFLSYWTLKESYLKARGIGLALPLDLFSFSMDGDQDSISIAFDTRLPDDASRWRFALHAASPRHLVAVAIEARGAPWSLRISSVVPLSL